MLASNLATRFRVPMVGQAHYSDWHNQGNGHVRGDGAVVAVADERVFFIWVSAHFPRVDHAVTDEEMAARGAENRGEYRAVCGAVFLPAPDDRPPCQPCPECGRSLQAQVGLPAAPERSRSPRRRRARHTGIGWWGRLCRAVS